MGGYKIASSQAQPELSDKSSQESEPYKDKYLQLKGKFKLLSDNEIENYISERDQDLKTSKADEVLTKLLKLFLIDVGLRLESQANRLEQSKLTTPKNTISNNVTPPVAIAPKCTYSKKACEDKYGPFKQLVKVVDWKKQEVALSGVRSENRIEPFLEDVKVDNLFDYLKNSYKPKRNAYFRFRGLFTGDVIFDNPKQSTLKMEFELKDDLVFKKGEYYGTYRIQLFRDGKSVSNSNGDGRLTFLKSYNEKSKGFIIQTGRLYFHLYFGPSRRFMFGNVYERKNVSSYLKVAKVILNKQ